MKQSLLPELCCPDCRKPLRLIVYERAAQDEPVSGVLMSECGSAFLVYKGVPRMRRNEGIPGDFRAAFGDRLREDAPTLASLPDVDIDRDFSFSFQWSTHAYDDLTWEMYLPERLAVFYDYTGLTRDVARGLRVLDAGCGNGTLTAALAAEGFSMVGMDYSDSVYRAREAARARGNDVDRLEYVQGDVMSPPFVEARFDLIYSDGVLHHTTDTRKAFLALAPMVRRGGRFFVWLYRADGSRRYRLKIATVRAVQKVTRGWSHKAKWRLCVAGAVVLLQMTRVARWAGKKQRRLLSVRLKALNLFDTIAPQYDHEHTPAEVERWYADAGFVDVREVTLNRFRLGEGGFAMIGTRR